jgi:hypothetical protein
VSDAATRFAARYNVKIGALFQASADVSNVPANLPDQQICAGGEVIPQPRPLSASSVPHGISQMQDRQTCCAACMRWRDSGR